MRQTGFCEITWFIVGAVAGSSVPLKNGKESKFDQNEI